MADETKIKVRLDPRQAKSQFRELLREGARTAGKVSGGIRRSVGRGLGAVGFGAAIGTGMAAFRGATQSGVGDVMGEALGGIGHRMAEFFLDDLNEHAKASRAAREETVQTFAMYEGKRGADTIAPGTELWFKQVQGLREIQEKGAEVIRGDDRLRGPSIGDIVDKIMKSLGTMVTAGFTALAAKLTPGGGR